MEQNLNPRISEKLSSIYKQRQERGIKIAALVICLLSCVLFLYYTVEPPEKDYTDWAKFRELLRPMAMLCIVASVGFATYMYAVGDFKSVNSTGTSQGDFNIGEFAAVLSGVEDAIDEIKRNRVLSEKDFQEISRSFTEEIQKVLPNSIFERMDRRYGQSAVNTLVSEQLLDLQQSVKSRLSGAQEDAKRKSSASLAWGLTIATIGVLSLGYFSIFPNMEIAKETNTYFLVSYHVSKFTFVILIESIALFFFAQYRISLAEEARLVQSASDYEVKIAGLRAACKLGETDIMRSSFAALSEARSGGNSAADSITARSTKQIRELGEVAQNLSKIANLVRQENK